MQTSCCPGHKAEVLRVAWSPDGRILASGTTSAARLYNYYCIATRHSHAARHVFGGGFARQSVMSCPGENYQAHRNCQYVVSQQHQNRNYISPHKVHRTAPNTACLWSPQASYLRFLCCCR
eukprot:GHUV01032180.1.p1 GENE.GHUV01032180.1~~GHUV01032180.1.p1  ORF type:complete len:121 (+),score=11.87 GHUV01032180.1:234-596(+)